MDADRPSTSEIVTKRNVLKLASNLILVTLAGCVSDSSGDTPSETEQTSVSDTVNSANSTTQANAGEKLSSPIKLIVVNKSAEIVDGELTVETRSELELVRKSISVEPGQRKEVYKTDQKGHYYGYFPNHNKENRYSWSVCSNYSDAKLVIPERGGQGGMTIVQTHTDPGTDSSTSTMC